MCLERYGMLPACRSGTFLAVVDFSASVRMSLLVPGALLFDERLHFLSLVFYEGRKPHACNTTAQL